MKIYLEAKQIGKEFSSTSPKEVVLKGVSVQFEQGRTYAIMGVSGTGKSTLLQIFAGLEEPTSGHVLYNNKNIFQFEKKDREVFLNQSIGLLFQQPYLIKELSVLENVMLPGMIAKQPVQECKKRAQDLLLQVELEHKQDQLPGTLSGGQQQRVALARALFNKPTFLLADEPTGNLDIATAKKMIELLLSLVSKNNMGLIISTHDEQVAAQMEEVFVLQDCKLQPKKMI